MQPVLAPDVLAVAGIVVLVLVCVLIVFTRSDDRQAGSGETAGPAGAMRGPLSAERQAKT